MDDHLTLELLRAVHDEDRNPRDLAALALAHLLDLCPHCHRVFHQWRSELERSGVGVPELAGEGGPLDAVAQEPQEPLPETLERVAELLDLPLAERVGRVRLQPERFRGPQLATLLLEEVRPCLPDRPREAQSIARLARAVVQHEQSTAENSGLYVRALAHEGNAARALGELEAAEELLETARFFMETQGCEDALAKADLDNLEGPLRRSQGRLSEARDLLIRAAEAYAQSGLRVEQARTLISLGIVWKDLGQLDRAIEVTNKAGDLLECATSDARLALYWRHNLAVFYRKRGDARRARELMHAAEDLYARFGDPWTQLRRRSVEGHLAQAEGDIETAEAIFLEVRNGFLREGRPLDAALAGRDLASLYGRQRRFAELEELTREIVAVFEELQVYPEADAARRFLEEATGSGSPMVH